MDEQTRRYIIAHIERVVDCGIFDERLIGEFRYDKRRTEHPDKCPCYQQSKPCHNTNGEELNCLLCYCPEYDNSPQEGGCKLPEKGKGEWFYHPVHPTGRILDCSHCNYPNKEDIVIKYLEGFFNSSEHSKESLRKYLKALYCLNGQPS
jgi:Zn-finger protein